MVVDESIPESPSFGNAAESAVLSYQGSAPTFPDGWTGNQVFGLPQRKWTPFFYRRIIQVFGTSFAYLIPYLAFNFMNTRVDLFLGCVWTLCLVAFIAIPFRCALDETKSYRIILSDQGVLRSVRTKAKEIFILNHQIDRISEVPNGLYIHCKQNSEKLFIYSELELFPILRARLNTVHPITTVHHPVLYALKTHGPKWFLLSTFLTSFLALPRLDPSNL